MKPEKIKYKLWQVVFTHEMTVEGDNEEEAMQNAIDGYDIDGQYDSHRQAYEMNHEISIFEVE